MMRRIIVLLSLLLMSAGAAQAQGGSAASPTLKVSDGQKSFNGVIELRVPVGCVTFSGRTAIINCTAGASSGTTSSQNGNLFYASPNGSYGLPTWRAAVEADLPSLSAAKIGSGIFATARLGSGAASSSTYLRGDQTWASLPADAVTSVFGRTGIVVAAANDYTWAQVNKATSSLADLTTRSAGDLSSGTLPDARFPATLPAASGVNLTALNGSNIASGTVAQARLPSSVFLVDGTRAMTGQLVVSRGPGFWIGGVGAASGIGMNRNFETGAIGNPTYGAFQHTQNGDTFEFQIYNGAGSFLGYGYALDLNLNFGFRTNSQFGSGAGVIGIANATSAPTTNPTGGGVLYVSAGTLNYRGTSGSAASVINADGTHTIGANGTAYSLDRAGTCTLVAGACTVSDANITTGSKIFPAAQDNNTTGALRISARVASTSFTITSSNAADTGVVAWRMIN